MTVRLNQIDKVKSSLLTLSLLSLIFSDKRNNFFRESIRSVGCGVWGGVGVGLGTIFFKKVSQIFWKGILFWLSSPDGSMKYKT